jgi:chaperonin GroES
LLSTLRVRVLIICFNLAKEVTGMAVNLKPLGDRVIVEPLEKEDMTASGIILPETAKERPQEGLVLSVGPGRWDEEGEKRIPLEVKVDDKVIFARYAGTEVKIDDKKLLILSEKDILAIVEK